MSGLSMEDFGFRSSLAVATLKLLDGSFEPIAAEFKIEDDGSSTVEGFMKSEGEWKVKNLVLIDLSGKNCIRFVIN